MVLRQALFGNRRFRLQRVIGIRTVIQTIVWSILAVAALTVYRTPTLLDGQPTMGAAIEAVPFALLPLVVVGVAVVVVAVNVLREIRYVLFGRRSRRAGSDGASWDDDVDGGGVLAGLGGLGGLGNFGDFDGDDGDDE